MSAACFALLALIAVPAVIMAMAVAFAQPFRYHDLARLPARPVAIVFGAGVTSSGKLTPILRARVDAAIALYRAGKVQTLLMTGDDAHTFHDEPSAMRRYAVRHGVPRAAIIRDYAGFRTYDSCYRARHIFGVDSAVLVTQGFHMPRALCTARALGIDAVGYDAADPSPPVRRLKMSLREVACCALGVIDLASGRQARVLGCKELAMTGLVSSPKRGSG